MLRVIAAILCTSSLISCATFKSHYQQPTHLLFQDKTSEKNQMIQVKRDSKLCADDTAELQNCPVNFYIDDYKAGEFYINNQAQYYLHPNTYTLKVKNCTTECRINELQVDLTTELQNREFVISVDENALPFLTQPEAEQPLSTEAQ